MITRVFGELPDILEGHIFESRSDLAASGVYKPRQAGISGSENEGADSIVLSGGYIDDRDFGNTVIYTGHGGRDPDTGRQVSDQLLTRGNKALAKNCIDGLPVRVVRGSGHRSPYSPPFGYRYDGLYRVESYWRETGKDGYTVWRFRLVKLENAPIVKTFSEPRVDYTVPQRVETTVQRIIRDTTQARLVKAMYDFHCQVCSTRLLGSAGPYAESAHIRPLGSPHDGFDRPENILCLCPNHHVLLDFGGFAIADDFRLIGVDGRLIIKGDHEIDLANIHYHRQHFWGTI